MHVEKERYDRLDDPSTSVSKHVSLSHSIRVLQGGFEQSVLNYTV